MDVYDIFSKRMKKQRGETPDVLISEPIPQNFRVQVVHIWSETIGKLTSDFASQKHLYKAVHSILCKEYGQFFLFSASEADYSTSADLSCWFLSEGNTEKVIDAIEISFVAIQSHCNDNYMFDNKTYNTNNEAISELNKRFLEHGLGYEYNGGQIIPITEEFTHSEIIKKSLNILNENKYQVANQEFREGFEHYKKGKYEEAIVSALKAFESTCKIILDENGWSYNPKDPISKLIKALIDKGLVLPELEAPLTSGLPPIRNKLGGHGAGKTPRQVPQEVAMYALQLSASNIVLLGKLNA